MTTSKEGKAIPRKLDTSFSRISNERSGTLTPIDNRRQPPVIHTNFLRARRNSLPTVRCATIEYNPLKSKRHVSTSNHIPTPSTPTSSYSQISSSKQSRSTPTKLLRPQSRSGAVTPTNKPLFRMGSRSDALAITSRKVTYMSEEYRPFNFAKSLRNVQKNAKTNSIPSLSRRDHIEFAKILDLKSTRSSRHLFSDRPTFTKPKIHRRSIPKRSLVLPNKVKLPPPYQRQDRCFTPPNSNQLPKQSDTPVQDYNPRLNVLKSLKIESGRIGPISAPSTATNTTRSHVKSLIKIINSDNKKINEQNNNKNEDIKKEDNTTSSVGVDDNNSNVTNDNNQNPTTQYAAQIKNFQPEAVQKLISDQIHSLRKRGDKRNFRARFAEMRQKSGELQKQLKARRDKRIEENKMNQEEEETKNGDNNSDIKEKEQLHNVEKEAETNETPKEESQDTCETKEKTNEKSKDNKQSSHNADEVEFDDVIVHNESESSETDTFDTEKKEFRRTNPKFLPNSQTHRERLKQLLQLTIPPEIKRRVSDSDAKLRQHQLNIKNDEDEPPLSPICVNAPILPKLNESEKSPDLVSPHLYKHFTNQLKSISANNSDKVLDLKHPTEYENLDLVMVGMREIVGVIAHVNPLLFQHTCFPIPENESLMNWSISKAKKDEKIYSVTTKYKSEIKPLSEADHIKKKIIKKINK